MATSSKIALQAAKANTELAKHILYRLFRDFDGCIRICLWDGSEVRPGHDRPEFSVELRSRRARILAFWSAVKP